MQPATLRPCRASYRSPLGLQVKRLPDVSSPESSSVVKGVAARKNVAHRRMRSNIDDPQVHWCNRRWGGIGWLPRE